MGSKKLKKLTEQEKLGFLEDLRFGGGDKTCPYCSSPRISGGIIHGKDYHCNECNRNFTLYTNTPLHGIRTSPLDLLECVKLYANSTNGFSCRELARNLEIGKKTTRRLLTAIRQNLPAYQGTFSGIIQADETYLGGKNRNRHPHKRVKNSQGRSGKGRQLILGIYDTATHRVAAQTATNANEKQLKNFILPKVERGSVFHTDEWKGYNFLTKEGYEHLRINHTENEFVSREGVTTNGIENFWSRLKRSCGGVYIQIPKASYEDFLREAVFRYNTPDHEERLCIILKSLLTPHTSPKGLDKAS